MASTCYASLQAVAMRVAKLSSSGAPLTGATNGYVTDALISLAVAVELNTGDEFTQKDGTGSICQTFKACDQIKRLTLTMNLCQLDSTLISYLTNADLFTTGGNSVGFQYPSVSAACPNGASLEVWTKAWDGGQQAVPPSTSPNAAYWHWVFPLTVWTMGSITLENALMVVPLTGFSSENSHITADGPFNDWPASVGAGGGVTHVGGVFLDSSLPANLGACVPIAVTSSS